MSRRAGEARYPRRIAGDREPMRPNPDLVRQAAHALAAAPSRDTILAKWGLTYDEVKDAGIGLHGGALTIPFYGPDGALQGVKLRKLGAAHGDGGRFAWLNPGKAPGIYLLQGAIDGPVVVLLEGPLKALAAWPFIQRPCAALASGAGVGIPKEARELFRERDVLYLGDPDAEGLQVPGLIRHQLRGVAHSLRAVAFPPVELLVPGQVADINDLLAAWRRSEPDGGTKMLGEAGNWILDALAEAPDLLARDNGGAGPEPAEPEQGSEGRPALNAGDLDLARIAEGAWGALLKANEPPVVFRFGGFPSWVERGDDGAPVARILTWERLRHLMARVATWQTFREGKARPAHPPLPVVKDMLARPNPPLPILTRIIEAPVFAPDGSLHLAPGYSPASRAYYAPAPGFAVPPVPDRPSAADLERARALLLGELLGDFPFISDAERAHALALLLLPAARELIDGTTPLHLIEKPTPGTGASLMADLLAHLVTGRRPGSMTEGCDEDEWRKRITAKLRGGPSVVLIDNVRRRLEAAALSAALTSDPWEDRLLGATEQVRVPVRCAWVATGNNPRLSDEIARRTVRIRLDARTDRPWLRDGFRHPDLRAWAAGRRGELVWATLTLIQAWLAAGRPEGKASLGGFERWAKAMGGILEVAGVPGFLENLGAFYEESDAEGAAWRSLVAAWWAYHGDREVGAAELFLLLTSPDGDSIDLGLGEGTDRALKTRFGKALGAKRDRQFGDLRIVRVGVLHSAQRWRLVQAQAGNVGNVGNVFPSARVREGRNERR